MSTEAKPSKIYTSPRNSGLREMTLIPIQAATKRLHEALPDLSPTHINVLGALGVGAGSLLASVRNQDGQVRDKALSAASLLLLSLGSGADAFDGSLARLIDSESPGSVDFKKGANYDVLSDRSQELLMALSRAILAGKRGDKFGKIAALVNGATNTLPSTAKALAESRGYILPETGRGILGLLGTRPGRASLGIAATVFPQIKNSPVQLIEDALVATANIVTAIDRLRSSQGAPSGILSEDQQHDANNRFKILLAFQGIALGAAIYTYMRLAKEKSQAPGEIEPKRKESPAEIDRYINILSGIERYCQENGLDHRFVGGTVTDLIGPQTEFEIDIEGKEVKLINPNNPVLIRSDGSVKDNDMVIFAKDQRPFNVAKSLFDYEMRRASRARMPYPNISIEGARYPDWPARNELKQFVSAFEVDSDGHLYLTFGKTKQEIPWETVEPWKLKLDNGLELTIFNPFAHALCYELRVPSGLKPKDLELHTYEDGNQYNKIFFARKLAQAVASKGQELGINYKEGYQSWFDYIDKLQNHPDRLTSIKASATGLYWRTIGTQTSHGTGIFGNLHTLSDKMNG